MDPIFDSHRVLTAGTSARFGIPPDRFAQRAETVSEAAWAEGLAQYHDGRPVPLPALPYLVQVTERAERYLATTVPGVFTALGKILTAHRKCDPVRDFLQVPDTLRCWTDASPAADYRIDFCRFDLVGGEVERARIVEFNASPPGGALIGGGLLGLWHSQPEVRNILEEWGASRTPMANRHWLAELLLSVTGARHCGGPVAVFRPSIRPGPSYMELERLVDRLRELGYQAQLMDPADPAWLRCGIRTGYLKSNIRTAPLDVGGWADFLEHVVAGRLKILGSLPGRWIGDNKLCLAVMSDPRFTRLFTSAEQAAIDRLIPVSRKVGDGVGPAELLGDQGGWVVKEPYDSQGASVFIGAEMPSRDWRNIIRHATTCGWLAQRIVPPGQCDWHPAPRHFQDLGIYLAQGRWAGYSSRISQDLRVNVSRGGGFQMVLGHRNIEWPTA